MERARTRFVHAMLLLWPLLFVALGAQFISRNSRTVDEALHLAAGYSYLAERDFRMNLEHPPLAKILAALPVWAFSDSEFAPRAELWDIVADVEQVDEQSIIALEFLAAAEPWALRLGRVPNLLLGLLLVCLVGWWSYRSWGKRAAVVALALVAMEPNLIAHSGLVTMDLALSLFVFSAFYLAWEYSREQRWGFLIGLGTSVGLALVSKFTAVAFLGAGLGAVLVIGLFSGAGVGLPGAEPGKSVGARLGQLALVVLVVVSVASLLIPIAYLFSEPGRWWTGFVWQAIHQEVGHTGYLRGEISNDGWWYYFPFAFVLKTPLGTLVLICLGFGYWRRGIPLSRRDAIFLLLPVVVVFATMALARINIGVRYVLAVYPFLAVFASRVATVQLSTVWRSRLLVAVPVVFTTISCLNVRPHHLAFFNGLIGGPAEGFRYLSDSNLDWGQDLENLAAWVRKQDRATIYLCYFGDTPPESVGLEAHWLPGGHRTPNLVAEDLESRQLIAISVFHLHGIAFEDHRRYAWLRRRQPVTKIGYSIFVYDISGDAFAHRRLAKVYLNDGRVRAAAAQARRAEMLEPESEELEPLRRRLQR